MIKLLYIYISLKYLPIGVTILLYKPVFYACKGL